MRSLWVLSTRCPRTRLAVSAASKPWQARLFRGSASNQSIRTFTQPHSLLEVRDGGRTLGITAEALVEKVDENQSWNISPHSDRASNDEIQWESLLDRGLAYGIKTREQLCEEADVGHMSDIGSRLSDTNRHRHDVELWEILLIAQAIKNGHEGIKAVWRGMKFRGEAFRLEGGDPRINAIWKLFLSAGAADHQFLWSICKEAKLMRYNRPRLFAEVVGAALEGQNPMEALKFASFVGVVLDQKHTDLLALFSAAAESRHPDALKAFCRLYDMASRSKIYIQVIGSLWKQGRTDDAFMMHEFLVSRKDLPLRFELLEPFINYLALQGESLDKFLSTLNLAGVSYMAQAKRLWSISRSRLTGVPSESLNIVASSTFGATPSKLSDSFIARAFATRAFSFDFAVQSLRMVGLIEVGPLAVRQMAMTSPTLEALQARFQKLRELGIDTGASVFVQVLKNVCDSGNWEMVRALVHNDLHHEVFEDVDLQKRLLTQYYRRKDWSQLNRTLAILNNGRFDDPSACHAANLVLVAMLEAEDWRLVLTQVTAIQQRGWRISQAFAQALLPLFWTSSTSLNSTSQHVDRPAYLIGVMQKIAASGTYIKPSLWRNAMRALGRQGRLKELELLVYWIAESHKPGGLNEDMLQVVHGHEPTYPKDVFDDKAQQSLMAWCFRPHVGMRRVSVKRCMRWTRILQRLRDEYGVEVKEYVIRWAFIKRLRRLFAPGMRSIRSNMIMRARNRTSIGLYWEMYDTMWDMKPAGPVSYDDRIKICMYARQVSARKTSRLLSLRLPRPAQVRRDGSPTDRHKDTEKQEDVVVYTDLFSPSWADYRRENTS